jgi:hypothetical protein
MRPSIAGRQSAHRPTERRPSGALATQVTLLAVRERLLRSGVVVARKEFVELLQLDVDAALLADEPFREMLAALDFRATFEPDRNKLTVRATLAPELPPVSGDGMSSPLSVPEGCIYSDRSPHQGFSPSSSLGRRAHGGSVWPDNVEKTGVSPGGQSGSPTVTAEAEQVERTRGKTWSRVRSRFLCPTASEQQARPDAAWTKVSFLNASRARRSLAGRAPKHLVEAVSLKLVRSPHGRGASDQARPSTRARRRPRT